MFNYFLLAKVSVGKRAFVQQKATESGQKAGVFGNTQFFSLFWFPGTKPDEC
jgi:hypothetical protein